MGAQSPRAPEPQCPGPSTKCLWPGGSRSWIGGRESTAGAVQAERCRPTGAGQRCRPRDAGEWEAGHDCAQVDRAIGSDGQ